MTKDEITEDVAATLNGLPERYDYFDCMQIVERKIGYFLKTDRAATIAALEDWLDPDGVA